MTFVDIAGIVRGASEGEGLGNQFLAAIRESDAICQVVRAFEDDDVIHVEGKIDPLADIETINTELILADLQTIDARSPSSSARPARPRGERPAARPSRPRAALDEGHTISRGPRARPRGARVTCTCSPPSPSSTSSTSTRRVSRTRASRRARGDGGAGGGHRAVREARGRARRASRTTTRRDAGSYGLSEPGLDRLSASASRRSASRPTSPPGPRSRGPGPSTGATPRPRRPASSTPISSVASSRPRSSASRTSSPQVGGQRRAAGKMRLEGKDYVMQDGDVVEFRFNV